MGTPNPWFKHPVAAGVVGVFCGALVVALVEWLGHQLLGAADVSRPASITPSMFATVLVAWVAGAGVAALVGTAWCGGRSMVPGLVAAGVLLAGSAATLVAFPHPVWMHVGALVLMPAAAWLAARSRVQPRSAAQRTMSAHGRSKALIPERAARWVVP
jgi:hypothetical protein